MVSLLAGLTTSSFLTRSLATERRDIVSGATGAAARGASGASTFIRNVPPLGRNHGELAADNLLRDGQVAEVLVEGRVTTEAEGQIERVGGGQGSEVGMSRSDRFVDLAYFTRLANKILLFISSKRFYTAC